jgi:hypothetical protein
MDVDIAPAAAWGQVIEDAICSSGVMLVLIGTDWMEPQQPERQPGNVRGGDGSWPVKSRLDDPEDYVRHEIETALQHNIHPVPVLVERAELPAPSDLPYSVRPLFEYQVSHLATPDFDYQVSRLLEVIAGILQEPTDHQEKPDHRPPRRADLLVRAPIAVSVPLLIFAMNYLVGYKSHSAAWTVLIAAAALAALVAITEYRRSRIWRAALACNCLWFILFAIYKVNVQQHLPSHHWKVTAGVTLAGVLMNAIFFIPALSSALSKRAPSKRVHPILPVFLGLMAAGLGIVSYGHIPGHENLYRGGALVLFAALAANLLAPVLALARRLSARPAAGYAGTGQSPPQPR